MYQVLYKEWHTGLTHLDVHL